MWHNRDEKSSARCRASYMLSLAHIYVNHRHLNESKTKREKTTTIIKSYPRGRNRWAVLCLCTGAMHINLNRWTTQGSSLDRRASRRRTDVLFAVEIIAALRENARRVPMPSWTETCDMQSDVHSSHGYRILSHSTTLNFTVGLPNVNTLSEPTRSDHRRMLLRQTRIGHTSA